MRGLGLLAFLAASLMGFAASAHDARPLSATFIEAAPGKFTFALAVPETVWARNQPYLMVTGCHLADQAPSRAPVKAEGVMLLLCANGMEGAAIEVRYPLANPSLSTLIQIERADGARLIELLPPEKNSWTVPVRPEASAVAADYFRLGMEHIWLGLDHLLFVAGLMVLAGGWRRILVTVTGFTLSHSVTLALAALDLVRVAVPPTEAAIALSILFLARELALPDERSLARRYPVAVSVSFGLLHGFGFAAVLAEIGLPPAHLVTGLLFFNVGVEAGQLLFILLLAAGASIFKRLTHARTALTFSGARVMAYAIGILAAYWFFDRLSGFA
ncbi:HupE/UreJ family protein [Pseudokordiimonas caeni]|uniref:HupE/UreJ family protein n=1 Tax=Pseudokordiimonas caeni TaxID=2997908 RepID=UPI0028122938|nr:HupE/UreJ family protein [Pseudokordiimonas caeni]